MHCARVYLLLFGFCTFALAYSFFLSSLSLSLFFNINEYDGYLVFIVLRRPSSSLNLNNGALYCMIVQHFMWNWHISNKPNMNIRLGCMWNRCAFKRPNCIYSVYSYLNIVYILLVRIYYEISDGFLNGLEMNLIGNMWFLTLFFSFWNLSFVFFLKFVFRWLNDGFLCFFLEIKINISTIVRIEFVCAVSKLQQKKLTAQYCS